jgi:hypothetical protein
MIETSSIKSRNKQKSYFDSVEENEDVVISKEYILTPDDDLASAITFDELLIEVKEDLREIFLKREK